MLVLIVIICVWLFLSFVSTAIGQQWENHCDYKEHQRWLKTLKGKGK